MHRATLTLLTTFCALAVLWASPSQSKPIKPLPDNQAIKIRSEQVLFDRDKPRKTRFGKLEWLGTLKLTSPSPYFGGYSGLVLDKTGTMLLAVSDKGSWLSARLRYHEGRLEKLTEAIIGPLRGTNRKPLKGRKSVDAEAIVMKQSGSVTGTAFIAFERRHRIAVHEVTRNGIGPAKRHLKLPARVNSIKGNIGLEGLEMLRAGPLKGTLLAFTEEYLDGEGDHIGWLIGGRKPGRIMLKRRGGFAITDLASFPGGDVVVLERRFRFTEGVKVRLRRIALKDIKRSARLDGDVLLKTDDLREIDNMEALAVHRDGRGRTILTIMSDDNFNRTFQRTLLMQFAIVE